MATSFINSLFQLLLISPLVLIPLKRNGNKQTRIIIIAALVFIITSIVTDLFSTTQIFKGQQWNWVGKAASLAIALIFIYSFRSLTPAQFGLTKKIEKNNAKTIFLVCGVYFLLRLILYITARKGGISFDAETILFQATLPGLSEEIIFRGILLALLNQIFTQPKWTIAKTDFGWAAVITSLLFGIIHGISLDSNFHIYADTVSIARTAFDGFLFALLTERTKSLVPAIVFHNLLNLIGNH